MSGQLVAEQYLDNALLELHGLQSILKGRETQTKDLPQMSRT
jgi:hypothetical protein